MIITAIVLVTGNNHTKRGIVFHYHWTDNSTIDSLDRQIDDVEGFVSGWILDSDSPHDIEV